MKKIAIIGNGTAGVITASWLNHHCRDKELVWYYDPDIKPQAVGEGSLLELSKDLRTSLDFNCDDLRSIGGTVKTGIRKYNWSNTEMYDENFSFGSYAMHFNAVKLQEFILNKMKAESNIKIIERNITADLIDADHIVDCTGFPKDFSNYKISEYIPVNATYVTQCPWDSARFNYTLTIARPYGWVFGIPLENRCAIGYMYNENITSLDLVKKDVLNVFDQFNLTPSFTTNSLKFKNYSRRNNFSERISFNGNASFFLEPLEATTISAINDVKRGIIDLIYNLKDIKTINEKYQLTIDETETIIMLHYFSGSKFNTEFWDYAQERGRKKIEAASKTDRFKEFLEHSKNKTNTTMDYGSWDPTIMNTNISNLKITEKIDQIIRQGIM